MIPTSTRAAVKTIKSIPASVDAVAVFVHKQAKSAAGYPSLPQPEQETVDRLLSSGVVRGKSSELTLHLLEGKTPRRLMIVGLGSAEKFSAECLREAGAALAKAAAKHRTPSIAVLPPAIPDRLPSVPQAKAE